MTDRPDKTPAAHEHGQPVLQDPLVAQRNPFEMVLLAWAMVVGLLSLFGVQLSGTLHVALDPFTHLLWDWTLLTGSGVGLLGLSMRGERMEIGFHLERFAMLLLGGGLAVYAVLLAVTTGLQDGGFVISQNVVFAAACAIRALQITRRFGWVERHTPPRGEA